MNFEVSHTWVRLPVSQLSVVLGKLIHFLEHILQLGQGCCCLNAKWCCSSTPQTPKDSLPALYRPSFLLFLNLLFILSSIEGIFHSCGPMLAMWWAGEAGRNSHMQHLYAQLAGCTHGLSACSHGSTCVARLTVSGALIAVLTDPCQDF